MTHLTRTSLLLAFFFAADKAVAILRQVVIARQFGLSPELDAFNVANNVPDLLFALISGGALAIAFIPVLSEVLTRQGREATWRVFSNVANLAFLVTAALGLVVFAAARPMVEWELGIAPGFGGEQQALVITLMRLNLVATLIFSISGLVMAGLQANQYFLLPAMAPLLYNLGQIFGALVLSPEKGYQLGGVTLPAMGLGVYGLVYGVILGAILHLAIQIPGLIRYRFQWSFGLGLRTAEVQKVLRVMGPRLISVFLVQLIFLVRDNLASRLAAGAVTALTYGWMIQQVPETLIGTAIGTALLPTLAEQVARKERLQFEQTLSRAVQVLTALTVPVAVVLGLGLRPLVAAAFGFDAAGTDLLMWATRGFLLGLIGHSLLEVAARSFYAQQDALTPLLGAVVNVTIYIALGSQLYRPFGPAGISLTDSVAFTVQAVLLLVLLGKPPVGIVRWIRSRFRSKGGAAEEDLCLLTPVQLGTTPWRSLAAGLVSGGVVLAVQAVGGGLSPLLVGVASMAAGGAAALPVIWREIRILLKM